ncbi:hypothetical protein HOLleu_42570 [Holothuria leucospilota]|uniref:Endonuclease/exonuclease/phosphatase domain-containing protein n=1 Tax=Holothuria leucospilota TaxID=206669 RepID=A0A9Q0YAR7_HOLLE|nr:hypothetical protein HOLleu_42570 [Holothuria leucospilota]
MISNDNPFRPVKRFVYSRNQLYSIRRRQCVPPLQQDTIDTLKAHTIWRFRGNRGGSHVRRSISTIVSFRGCYATSQLRNPNALGSEDRQTVRVAVRLSPLLLDFGLINARSVKNKDVVLVDYIIDHNLDLLGITETWLSTGDRDNVDLGRLKPAGYEFRHVPRLTGRGGGLALIYRQSLTVNVERVDGFTSFECMVCNVSSNGKPCKIYIIYAPPPIRRLFIDEFSLFLENMPVSSSNVILAGDFNCHVNDIQNSTASALIDAAQSVGFTQHVRGATHVSGNTLDLVFSRLCENIIADVVTDSLQISDHYPVLHYEYSLVTLFQ